MAGTGGFQGKPKFKLTIEEVMAVLVQESVSGILGVIMFDDTADFDKKEYYNATQVKQEDWSEENYNALKSMAFRGNPFKVVVYKATPETLSEVLDKRIAKDEPNYLCCPFADKQEGTIEADLESWINNKRNDETIKLGNNTSTIKLVISSKTKPNQPWIIDYDARQTQHVIADFDDITYDAQEYTLCIASMCAGTPINGSMTSAKEPWLKAFTTTVGDEDGAIREGKLITSFDGDEYEIWRGVTSFTQATDTKNITFSKIRMMEIMDLNQKDIRIVFTKMYRGDYVNSYKNRNLLFGAINAYLKKFVDRGQLDPAYDNKMVHDLEGIRNHIRATGKYMGKPITEDEIMKLKPKELVRANTGDDVYAIIPQYRPTDVMEDFDGKAILA